MDFANRNLSYVALPDWKDLFRSLLFCRNPSNDLLSLWAQEGELAGWFSRTAWSFTRIALWRSTLLGKIPVVWVPDFFCDSTLTPLRAMGVRLVFYPVTKLLQPDYEICRQLAQNESPDIFVLVHYFGAPVPASPARDFCRRMGAWLVEDAAHVLKPTTGIGEYGDFIVYSPHKLLPIPDGAVLIARPNGAAQLGSDGLSLFYAPKIWADELASLGIFESLRQSRHAILVPVWVMKRILQKLGFRGKHKFVDFVANTNEPQKVNFPVPQASQFSLRLITKLLVNFDKVTRWRQRNVLFWDVSVVQDEVPQLKATTRPLDQEWTSYLAGYELADPENSAVVFEHLQQMGLPVMTWPDLPREVSHNQARHKMAWTLRHTRIYFPVHQSIRPQQIDAYLRKQIKGLDRCSDHVVPSVARNLQSNQGDPSSQAPQDDVHGRNSGQGQIVDNGSSVRVRIAWDMEDEKQWHAWMIQVGRSNLLQSYEYGQAKSKTEGWCVRRGVFYVENEPIAIVQVLKKKLLGCFTVSRVNRGPLYLKAVDQSLRVEVIRCLCKELSSIRNGKFFSFTPELPLSGESIQLLLRLGIKQFNSNGWRSIYLNLSQDEAMLRAALQGKWRNMLVFAEKQNIDIRVEQGKLAYEWLVTQCETMLKQRGHNFSRTLYNVLYQELDNSQRGMLIFRAFLKNEAIAGIGIVVHGSSATYLLGWNSDTGRRLKVNQLLLWKSLLFLKDQGFLWFDLGGIDEEKVPGISAFKKGMGGETYSLVGDGWKL